MVCKECTAVGQCTACVEGYYLEDGLCQDCDTLDGETSCLSCVDKSECEECNIGYRLSADNKCLSCDMIDNCASCD